jgi:methyl-accepting chemotaxis protein
MSLDFTTAKLKHSSWKLKLRDFLDGKPGLTPAQATSHRDCDLGKWFYGDGLAKFGAVPEMKTLEREHESLHKLIKTIMDLKTAGKPKEAEAEFLKVEPISRKIIELLTVIEAKVNTKAA